MQSFLATCLCESTWCTFHEPNLKKKTLFFFFKNLFLLGGPGPKKFNFLGPRSLGLKWGGLVLFAVFCLDSWWASCLKYCRRYRIYRLLVSSYVEALVGQEFEKKYYQ